MCSLVIFRCIEWYCYLGREVLGCRADAFGLCRTQDGTREGQNRPERALIDVTTPRAKVDAPCNHPKINQNPAQDFLMRLPCFGVFWH